MVSEAMPPGPGQTPDHIISGSKTSQASLESLQRLEYIPLDTMLCQSLEGPLQPFLISQTICWVLCAGNEAVPRSVYGGIIIPLNSS